MAWSLQLEFLPRDESPGINTHPAISGDTLWKIELHPRHDYVTVVLTDFLLHQSAEGRGSSRAAQTPSLNCADRCAFDRTPSHGFVYDL